MSIVESTAPTVTRDGFVAGQRQGGFSLVEVMVALVVLSVGLLALANLQTRAMSGSSSSYQRTQATLAAYDIIDRIRANRVAAAAVAPNNYDIDFPVPPSTIVIVPPDAATIARRDLLQWKGRLPAAAGVDSVPIAPPEGLASLPMGDGFVRVTGLAVTVIVRWDDNRDGDNTDDEEQIQTDSRL